MWLSLLSLSLSLSPLMLSMGLRLNLGLVLLGLMLLGLMLLCLLTLLRGYERILLVRIQVHSVRAHRIHRAHATRSTHAAPTHPTTSTRGTRSRSRTHAPRSRTSTSTSAAQATRHPLRLHGHELLTLLGRQASERRLLSCTIPTKPSVAAASTHRSIHCGVHVAPHGGLHRAVHTRHAHTVHAVHVGACPCSTSARPRIGHHRAWGVRRRTRCWHVPRRGSVRRVDSSSIRIGVRLLKVSLLQLLRLLSLVGLLGLSLLGRLLRLYRRLVHVHKLRKLRLPLLRWQLHVRLLQKKKNKWRSVSLGLWSFDIRTQKGEMTLTMHWTI
jgi:hypothetical protein